VSIEDVARELYGLVPEEFTAARNARAKLAKADGDAELAGLVQSLRKPTAGAWLLNQLVRQHADEVQQVLDLGAQLRAAQGTLAADELRALDRQRRQLTRAVAEQARDLGRDAGRRVTDATTADVEETLRSAMVDAAAGAALSTGLLTDTFSSTGIEPVDLSRVVALAPPGAEPDATASAGGVGTQDRARPDPARQRLVAKAEQAVAEAEAALREAHEQAETAAADLTRARHEREQVESAREEARRRLLDLDAEVQAATEAEETASRDHERAQRDAASAVDAAAQLAEELQALRE
jgi:chromosome segregation ATPase